METMADDADHMANDTAMAYKPHSNNWTRRASKLRLSTYSLQKPRLSHFVKATYNLVVICVHHSLGL
eukprot:1153194-Pelagomonas_calceolata.AAC.1